MGNENNEKNQTDDVFDKIKDAHKQITEQMWLLQNTLPYLNNEESYSNVRKVVDYFKNTILGHFEWEEHDIFPIALAIGEIDIKQIVRELQQEHIFIISKFDVLSDIIVKHGFAINDEKIKSKFIDTSKEMLSAVLRHSHKEDEELYPFLRNKNVTIDFQGQGG